MKKRTAARKTDREFTVAELADAVIGAFPELNEAYTRADIELALDDRGWEKMIYGNVSQWQIDQDQFQRKNRVFKSRLYWQRDPLAKQAVRLWTDYGFGNGATFACDDEAVQGKIDQFCKANRRYMSARGQQRLSKRLLVDGDLFVAVFDDGDGDGKEMRLVEPLQVTHIISDPDDDDRVLLYRRETAKGDIMYYVDWEAAGDDSWDVPGLKDPADGRPVDRSKVQDGVVMYHVAFDAMGKFGHGLLAAALDWSREHRRFMEARVAITQALAKYAWKGEVKGGQSALNKVQQRLQSTLAVSGTQGGMEKNPSPAAASTWLQNAGIDMTPMPRTTGAGDAKQDSDSLKLMVCSGTGIMLHYFGDPSTGNLATATAMELPMLKQFAAYQMFWTEAFRDLFAIVLDEEPEAQEAQIDIDLPAILERDLQALGSFLTAVSTMFPEVKVPEVLQMVLAELGINNLEEVMKKIAENKKAIDAKAEQDAKMNNALTMAKANNLDAASASKLAESYNNLTEQLRAFVEKLG